MIHPDTEIRFINDDVGLGVIAKRPIPCGTVTWVMDSLDRTFSPADLDQLQQPVREVLDRYSYRNRDGHYVYCWDHAKYMNHSFHSNCLLTAYGLEIAVRDIAAGEGLTNDYGCFNIIESFAPCEEQGSRQIVQPDDLKNYHQEWDAKIQSSVKFLPKVEQALRGLIEEATWQELNDLAFDRFPLLSVASLLFTGDE